MNILAVDTSTDLLSIALKTDSGYEERLVDSGISHLEGLLPEIDALSSRMGIDINELELLAVTKGPGSFTGLRIGMATLKGIACALDIPLVSVPTLDAIIASVSIYSGPALAVIGARKKKFYLKMMRNQDVVVEARDGRPEDIIRELRELDEPVLITGPDALLFAEKLSLIDDQIPYVIDPESPRNLSRALMTLALEKYRRSGADDIGEGPMYIRRSDAEEALEKRIREAQSGQL